MDSENANRVSDQLDVVEGNEGVRILYVCESGSHAWGFESADGDFDVRFLYVHPTEWYLSIQRRPDTIERSVDPDLDLVGWDLHMAQSNFREYLRGDPGPFSAGSTAPGRAQGFPWTRVVRRKPDGCPIPFGTGKRGGAPTSAPIS